MSKYASGLIGLDFKPRRKVGRNSRNRYRSRRIWVFPALLIVVMLGLFLIVGIR